jgi:leucyl-tRNA synthetase
LLLIQPLAQLWRSIFNHPWPTYDEEVIKEEEVLVVVQVNGKLRSRITVPANLGEAEVKEIALSDEKVKRWIEGKEVLKIIFVPYKLINLVAK